MARRRTRANTDQADESAPGLAPAVAPCWLCNRPLGRLVEWHHPVPKSRGGRAVVGVHPICHRILHTTFTNAELARIGLDVGQLRANEGIDKFLKWVAEKDPDFHVRTAKRAKR